MMRRSRLALWLTAFALVNTASADDLSGVTIERDKLEQVEGACRAVLVIENGIGADFEALALDLVVFDADGVIAERLAVDLAPLAAGKASVKAFDIAGLDCADAGRFLMNGVLGCRSLGDAPIVAAILGRVSEDGVLAGDMREAAEVGGVGELRAAGLDPLVAARTDREDVTFGDPAHRRFEQCQDRDAVGDVMAQHPRNRDGLQYLGAPDSTGEVLQGIARRPGDPAARSG